jgi:hypothetical protein
MHVYKHKIIVKEIYASSEYNYIIYYIYIYVIKVYIIRMALICILGDHARIHKRAEGANEND